MGSNKLENLFLKKPHEQAAFTLTCLLGAANIWTRFQRSQNQRRAVGQYIVLFSSAFLLWWRKIRFSSA